VSLSGISNKLLNFFHLKIPGGGIFNSKDRVVLNLRRFLQAEFSISSDRIIEGPLCAETVQAISSPGCTVEMLAEKVAGFLGVEFCPELTVPRSMLFSGNDRELNRLIESGFIPQQDSSGRAITLVTSDFEKLARVRKEDYSGSFSFALVTGEEFEKTSKRIKSLKRFLSSEQICNSQWRKAFVMCFLDALELGAQEIYFGIPDPESYEFTVSGKRYGGVIASSVRETGLSILESGQGAELARETGFEGRLSFSKTVFKGREVFVCSWGATSGTVTPISVAASPVSRGVRRVPHILLIDDDRRFAELLKRGIAAKGFSVSVATSVNDALLYHLEASEGIDLVVTDYHMPNVKGSELLEIVRAKKGELPVIVLTSDEETDTYVHMLGVGCDAVVRKGDDPRILFAWIFRLLEKHYKPVKEHCVQGSNSANVR
jgi:CheY-like chemotaxis protein